MWFFHLLSLDYTRIEPFETKAAYRLSVFPSLSRGGGMLRALIYPPTRPVPRNCETHQRDLKTDKRKNAGDRSSSPLFLSWGCHEVGHAALPLPAPAFRQPVPWKLGSPALPGCSSRSSGGPVISSGPSSSSTRSSPPPTESSDATSSPGTP